MSDYYDPQNDSVHMSGDVRSGMRPEMQAGLAGGEGSTESLRQSSRLIPTLFHWIGGIISLLLIAGLVYWGFLLANRDPSAIPVILALEGKARVEPADPGGLQAEYQGLTVNAVQTDAGAETAADALTLAPEEGRLQDEDKAGLGLSPKARPETPADIPPNSTRETPTELPTETPANSSNAAPSLVDLITATIKQDQANLKKGAKQTTTESTTGEIAKDQSGNLVAPQRPLARPLGEAFKASVLASAAPQPADADSVSTVPLGARLIHLGAFDSELLALAEWETLRANHIDLLEGKKRLIEVADAEGRTYYRLRAAGFASLDESRNLCTAMVARGSSCIPVTAR